MKIINITKGKDNYLQSNNILRPFSACMATAITASLYTAGLRYPDADPGLQPEDYLSFRLSDNHAQELNWIYIRQWGTKVDPWTNHYVVMKIVNEIFGRQVDLFGSFSMQKIIHHMLKHRIGVPVSTNFTTAGHIVSIVGIATKQSDIETAESPRDIDLEKVTDYIIDDPMGKDFVTGYKSGQGFDQFIEADVIHERTKRYGNTDKKFAHLLTP